MTDDAERPTLDERRGSRPRSEPSASAPEDPEGRYQLGTEIARGGMGRVVEATDTVLGRTVALKAALSTDPEAIRRFRREIHITARLEHPSIVPVHDAGTQPDGSPFYVMRRVSGRPLDRLVAETETLAERLGLLPILVAAAQALGHAHRRGVIHRDIKPSNILVGDLGETVVIDWGLAKVIDEPDEDDPHAAPALDAGSSLRTRIGTVFGTPGFMSPEQLRGEPVDARSDVYALGATLYFMLSRHPPHSSESEDDMMAAAAAGPPMPIGERVAGIPPELSTIVDKSLAFDDRERYADAATLAEDLGRFLAGQLVASHRYSPAERVMRLVRRNRISFAIAAIAFIGFVAGGWLAIHRIVAERDRANDQTLLATTRAHDAELAKQREQDRADQLVLTQARTLAVTNPTAAIAVLKQLRTPAERWNQVWLNVRDIAAGAREAGVAWSVEAPTTPMSLELAPNGTRAVVTGNDGSIRIIELVDRTQRSIATLATGSNARFISDDVVAIYRNTSLVLIDLRDGSRVNLTMAADVQHTASTPTTLFWTDVNHDLWRLAGHGGTPERIPVSDLGLFDVLAASPDAHWLAVSGDRGVLLIEVDGPIRRQLVKSSILGPIAWSPDSRSLAVAFMSHIDVMPIAGGPVRTYPAPPYTTALEIGSHDRLFASTLDGLMASFGAQLAPYTDAPPAVGGRGFYAGDADRVVYSTDNAIVVIGKVRTAKLQPPIEGFLRLAVSRHSSFVLAAAPGRVLVWNLDDTLPPAVTIDDVSQYAMLGTHHAIASHVGTGWSWNDLETRKATAIEGLPELPLAKFISGVDEAALLVGGPGDDAYMIRNGGPAEVVAHSVRFGTLTGREAVFAMSAGPIVSYDLATKQTTTVIEHGEDVVSIPWNDAWFAMAFTDGTLRRRDRKTGVETTVKLPVTTHYEQNIVLDPSGNVFASVGNKIMCWHSDGRLVDHATVTSPIEGLLTVGRTLVAYTDEHAGYAVAMDRQDQVIGRIPPGTRYFASGESSLMATEGAGGNLIILDLLTGERWPLQPPSPNGQIAMVQISSDGRLAAGLIGGTLWVWPIRLPATAAETAAWLDRMTNATSELGTSTLTWQPQTPP